MSAPPEERLALALTGVEYFMSCVRIDLEDDDREKLRDHMSHLRQSVITALKAYNELPPPTWPNAETREAFGRAAAEWRAQRAPA